MTEAMPRRYAEHSRGWSVALREYRVATCRRRVDPKHLQHNKVERPFLSFISHKYHDHFKFTMSIDTNPTLLASLTRGSSAPSTPSSSVPITPDENASLYAPTPPPKEVPSPAPLSQSPFTSS